MVLPSFGYRSIPYASVLDYRHTMTEPLWLLSPRNPYTTTTTALFIPPPPPPKPNPYHLLLSKRFWEGLLQQQDSDCKPPRKPCLSRYLANSEEIISKHQSGFLSLH